MKHFERRIWVTAGVMSLCCLGVLWVRAGYTFEVVPLKRSLASIPLKIDGWHGSDRPQDGRVREILNAQESLNRIYHHRDGAAVWVSISAWLRPDAIRDAAPHVPKICYTNSGWTILGEQQVQVSTPTGDLPVTTLLLERKGEQIVVAYWYQMGAAVFNSVNEARSIHRDLWGKRKWPATVKVLLQTPASSIATGLPTIERIAVLVRQQLSGVLGTSDGTETH